MTDKPRIFQEQKRRSEKEIKKQRITRRKRQEKKRKPVQYNRNGIRIQSDRPPHYKYKEEKEE